MRFLKDYLLRMSWHLHPMCWHNSFCSFLNLTICNIIRIGPAGMAFRPFPEAISVLPCVFAQEAAVASCRCQQACCRRRRSVGMRLRLRMPWRRRRRRRDRLSRHRCRELRAVLVLGQRILGRQRESLQRLRIAFGRSKRLRFRQLCQQHGLLHSLRIGKQL